MPLAPRGREAQVLAESEYAQDTVELRELMEILGWMLARFFARRTAPRGGFFIRLGGGPRGLGRGSSGQRINPTVGVEYPGLLDAKATENGLQRPICIHDFCRIRPKFC